MLPDGCSKALLNFPHAEGLDAPAIDPSAGSQQHAGSHPNETAAEHTGACIPWTCILHLFESKIIGILLSGAVHYSSISPEVKAQQCNLSRCRGCLQVLLQKAATAKPSLQLKTAHKPCRLCLLKKHLKGRHLPYHGQLFLTMVGPSTIVYTCCTST